MIKINGFFVFLFANWILCSYAQFSQFEVYCLNEHNKFRAEHHSPPLILNRSLCDFAKNWANHLANTNSVSHRPNNRFGENIFKSTISGLTVNGKTAVDAWYSGVRSYNYNQPGLSPATRRFTQVVWKNSKGIGCAIVRRDSNTWVVANYNPAGNLEGQFPQNVLRP